MGKAKLAGLAAALAASMLAAAPAAAGTVVGASGPSAAEYPVGTQLPDTRRITLSQGDTLTVLDNGGTRILRGPGTFILARQGARTRNSAFAALTSQRADTRARVASSRDSQAGQEIRNPKLWYVNIAASGRFCLNDASTAIFWRAQSDDAATYSVAMGEDEEAELAFPEKEILASISGDQVREDTTYTITGPSLDQATEVSFVVLDDVPREPEAMAQVLIANGCMGQLQQLSSALAEG